jgi:glyoxylase-like metal-dependent hydrolase (beta-lactamase superfamily II)
MEASDRHFLHAPRHGSMYEESVRAPGPRTKRIAAVAVALIALLAIAKHFLLDSAAVPESTRYRIDLEAVRGLARARPEELPVRINAAVVARSYVPSFAVVAGTGFDRHEMVRTAYQVVYSGSSMLIDVGTNAMLHAQMSEGDPFYPEIFDAVQRAIAAAELVVVTHEHPDHVGGIIGALRDSAVVSKLRLTREQADNRNDLVNRAKMPAQALAAVPVERYERHQRIAPGVVLIKAPGHTPGSQMVYVLTRSGTEYLFVGDIAWHMDNVRRLTGRAWLVARFIVKEDRTAVLEQLRALHELDQRTRVHLVVSHDGDQLERYMDEGLIGRALQ